MLSIIYLLLLTDDLYDIFMRYYDNNPDSVPEKSVLEGCIAEMYGVRYATSMQVAGQKLCSLFIIIPILSGNLRRWRGH